MANAAQFLDEEIIRLVQEEKQLLQEKKAETEKKISEGVRCRRDKNKINYQLSAMKDDQIILTGGTSDTKGAVGNGGKYLFNTGIH